jgi:LPS export ABC transporter protein LptC
MWRIIILAALIAVAGCTRLYESTPSDKNAENLPSQTISQGKIDVVKGGRLEYIIQAGRIRSYEKERLTLLDSGVVVDFFDREGRHTSKLTSDEARVDEGKNVFKALGNVVVRTDSGDMLLTERLFWDEAKRKIRSDTMVTMMTEFDSLRGYNFEADEDLTSWQIQRPSGQTMRKLEKP